MRKIFTKEHTREYSLFRVVTWYKAMSRKMADIVGVSVDEATAVYRGGDLVEIYYDPDGLKKVFQAVAKSSQNKQAMIANIKDFLNRFEHLKKYFTGEKQIKSVEELKEFQEEYVLVWAWIGVIFMIPTLPVDEELKKAAYNARVRTQEYNETPEIVFREFLEKQFSKLKGKTRFILPDEVWSGQAEAEETMKKIKEREGGFIFYKNSIYTGDLEKNLEKLNIALEERESVISGKAEISEKELRGQTANPGKAVGTAKVISSEKGMTKIKEGDILVVAMTMPKYLPAMKKAAAFITDEGGMTSHAAIVAGEMNKPCVVGTKVATKVLKDGDRVEIDADKGIVRKL